jgi:hypothetical protein
LKFSNCALQQFGAVPGSGGWSRNHEGKSRKSAAASDLMQINCPCVNKPNRVDQLGKHGVHQY